MKNSRLNFGMEFILMVQILLLAMEFFCTQNPYLAFHSGMGMTEDALFFHLGSITTISLILIWMSGFFYLKKSDIFVIVVFGVLFCIQLFEYGNPFSIAFPYFSLFGLKLFSRNSRAEIKWDKVFLPVFLLFLLGLFLAVLKPGVWGSPVFEFLRNRRGELTFNDMLGLNFLVTTLFVYKSWKNPIYIIGLITLFIFLASFGSRRYLLLVLPGLFFSILRYLFYLKGRSYLAFYFGISICVLLILISLGYLEEIYNYFPGERGDISTGRLELWGYYWNLFLSHPFIGNGTRIVVPGYFVAETEVGGLLAYLTKFGIIFTSWQLFHIFPSLKSSLCRMLVRKEDSNLFFYIVVIVGSPLYFFEGIYSVMDPAGMLFWYSIFKIGVMKSGLNQSEDCAEWAETSGAIVLRPISSRSAPTIVRARRSKGCFKYSGSTNSITDETLK